MSKENRSFEFRLKNIDETRNYLLEEIKHNDLIREKHKKVDRALNYFEHFFICSSDVSGCVSIFAFTSLVGVPACIASPAIGLNICALTTGIKMHKSVIKKKRKKHDKIVLLAKTKLNIIKVLSLKALIGSYIIHHKFV